MMNYKGYGSTIRFDDEAEIFHGEVSGLRDVVTFQGKTVDELKTAFQESIDDYLEYCEGRGESPDKPFSGRFLLRIDPSLHRRLVELSADEGESLNNWIASRLGELTRTTWDEQDIPPNLLQELSIMHSNLSWQVTLIAAFALVTSCAHQDSGRTRPIDHKFVADVTPLSPPDSRNLQKYALTLPIFEMTDQAERNRWVSNSERRRESRDELVLVGDGAQDSMAIQRISAADSVNQRIHLTIWAQGGGPDPIYELIRVPGGGKRTGMKRVEGAWDKIYWGTYTGGDENKEAQQ